MLTPGVVITPLFKDIDVKVKLKFFKRYFEYEGIERTELVDENEFDFERGYTVRIKYKVSASKKLNQQKDLNDLIMEAVNTLVLRARAAAKEQGLQLFDEVEVVVLNMKSVRSTVKKV
jgi:hypothetical protein